MCNTWFQHGCLELTVIRVSITPEIRTWGFLHWRLNAFLTKAKTLVEVFLISKPQHIQTFYSLSVHFLSTSVAPTMRSFQCMSPLIFPIAFTSSVGQYSEAGVLHRTFCFLYLFSQLFMQFAPSPIPCMVRTMISVHE